MNVPALPDIREHLLELQGHRCGICGVENPYTLELDHDHATGFVRGYLCSQCNAQEGRHAPCVIPEGCPICRWRLHPATAWLGWTEQFARYSLLAFDRIVLATMRDRWQPTNEMVVLA